MSRAEFWNPCTLQYQFAAEVRRLWDMESDDGDLLKIQAGLVMSLASNVSGIDKVGWRHVEQAVDAAKAIRLFDPPPEGELRPNATAAKMEASRALTAWAVFCWQS